MESSEVEIKASMLDALLKRIETLEKRISDLEANRHVHPIEIKPITFDPRAIQGSGRSVL